MDSTPNRQTVSFEELAYSNMLTLSALIELMDEMGKANSWLKEHGQFLNVELYRWM
jgi:hypothetical protein